MASLISAPPKPTQPGDTPDHHGSANGNDIRRVFRAHGVALRFAAAHTHLCVLQRDLSPMLNISSIWARCSSRWCVSASLSSCCLLPCCEDAHSGWRGQEDGRARPRTGLCICGRAFRKFKIGQRVSFRPSRDDLPTTYIVTAKLPQGEGEFNTKSVARLRNMSGWRANQNFKL